MQLAKVNNKVPLSHFVNTCIPTGVWIRYREHILLASVTFRLASWRSAGVNANLGNRCVTLCGIRRHTVSPHAGCQWTYSIKPAIEPPGVPFLWTPGDLSGIRIVWSNETYPNDCAVCPPLCLGNLVYFEYVVLLISRFIRQVQCCWTLFVVLGQALSDC